MPKNNAKTWMVVALVLTVIGIACTVVGFGEESEDWIWLGAVGIMFSVTFLICFFVFCAMASRLDRMLRKEEILAHWQFDPTEQLQKAQEELNEKKRTNRVLLIVITALFIVIGALFAGLGFDDLEEASGFLLILLGVLAIIWIAALSAPRAAYRRMTRSVPEVYVGPSGAWVMGMFTLWNAPMSRIARVIFDQTAGRALIAVEYRVRQRYGWQHSVCRIPVPAGNEEVGYHTAYAIAVANAVELQLEQVSGQ